MSSRFNSLVAEASKNAKNTMDSFMIGTFVLNFVVSFSMKKLLQSMRVLQLISFMVFLKINFTPISKFFMEQLHAFVTFKVVPPEFMLLILAKLGVKNQREETTAFQSSTRRLLEEEPEAASPPVERSMLEDLNLIIVGVVGFGVLMIIGGVAILCFRNRPHLHKKLKHKLLVIFFNALHQTMTNASLPIIINAMYQIQANVAFGKSTFASFAPILIITVFGVYPLVVSKLMPQYLKKLESDQLFAACHLSSLSNLSPQKLAFLIPIHLRRLLYCSVLVFLISTPGLQIVSVTLISEAMILLLAMQPFEEREVGRHEVLSEVVIIVFAYHVILVSDMVPASEQDLKHAVGISMICFLTLVMVFFIFRIVRPFARICRLKIKRQLKIMNHKRQSK